MNVRVRRLAAAQADLFSAWQLAGLGWSWKAIEHRLREADWRVVHDGVYTCTHGPLTREQLWIAATLTAPQSYLAHESAGACFGIRRFSAEYETVVRAGSGGPKRLGQVLIRRSKQLDGETTTYGRVPITAPARTLIDLAPREPRLGVGRMFRETLRLKLATAREVAATLARHRGRRGTRLLWELTDRYSSLPYSRCRSDAESRALEVLHDAGVEIPAVNVRVGGEEADLVWRRHRRIIEIDGPQYHQFSDEDSRKQGCWKKAGYEVKRLPSGLIYAEPGALLELAPPPRPR